MLRSIEAADREAVEKLVSQHFGSSRVVSLGVLHHASELPGWLVEVDTELRGVLCYDLAGRDCEVVVLIASPPRQGLGSCLLQHLYEWAEHQAIDRLWLITTNDNQDAITFFRRSGWKLKAIHEGAVHEARKLKPEIPLVSDQGIAIADEWEFEYQLHSNVGI